MVPSPKASELEPQAEPPVLRARQVEHIVIRPDQVVQRDLRPWNRASLTLVVVRFLVLSALIVAAGTVLLVLGLRQVL
jgi:hypothetical protein